MKKSMILAGMSIFACLLCACSSNQSSSIVQTTTSVTGTEIMTTTAPSATGETIVTGYSLDKLQLGIHLPMDVDFGDKNARKYSAGQCSTLVGRADAENSNEYGGIYTGSELEGQCTLITAEAADTQSGGTYIPVAVLQGFDLSALQNPQSTVKVKGKEYSYAQLKEYIVYESKKIIVCDFTSLLLPEKSLDEYLQQYRNKAQDKNYDYSWVKNMYRYVQKNSKTMVYHDTMQGGYSLEELGLKISVPKNVDFENRNSNVVFGEQWGCYSGEGDTLLAGKFTDVFAITPGQYVVEEVPVMLLQGFYVRDYESTQNTVTVKDTSYTYQELTPYIVYNDGDTFVCDFTPLLLPQKDFEDSLQEHLQFIPDKNYDISWTKNCYQYFHDNISKLIEKA